MKGIGIIHSGSRIPLLQACAAIRLNEIERQVFMMQRYDEDYTWPQECDWLLDYVGWPRFF